MIRQESPGFMPFPAIFGSVAHYVLQIQSKNLIAIIICATQLNCK